VTPIGVTRVAAYAGIIPTEAGAAPADTAPQSVQRTINAQISSYDYGAAIRKELQAFSESETFASGCLESST